MKIKKKIFIAYNTDSLVWELTLQNPNKYKKLSRDIQKNKDIKKLMNRVYNETGILNQDVDFVSPENKQLREEVFKQIQCHLTTSPNGQNSDGYFDANNAFYQNCYYSYYIDILDRSWQTNLLSTHYAKNKQTIKLCDALLFVIAREETSFWQLQEAYFASFYDKPIIFVNTQKFLKLVAKHRLHKFIGKKLNSIDNYAQKPYRPSPAQRSN